MNIIQIIGISLMIAGVIIILSAAGIIKGKQRNILCWDKDREVLIINTGDSTVPLKEIKGSKDAINFLVDLSLKYPKQKEFRAFILREIRRINNHENNKN